MMFRNLICSGLAVLAAAAPSACGSQQREAEPTTATLASSTPAPAPTPQTVDTATAPPLPSDLLAVGSQQARDELYCQALIYAENPDVSDALAPVDEAQLRKRQALGFIIGEAGINRMVAEKAVHATQARAIADAYAAQVDKDLKSNTPRITLDDCNARARAIPIPE